MTPSLFKVGRSFYDPIQSLNAVVIHMASADGAGARVARFQITHAQICSDCCATIKTISFLRVLGHLSSPVCQSDQDSCVASS